MRPQIDEDVQVAARTTAEPGFALAGDAQPHAAVNSRRDAHRDCALRRGPAAPAALGAGIAEDRPGPAAGTAPRHPPPPPPPPPPRPPHPPPPPPPPTP